MKKYYGGIEAGGTKFVCALGNGPRDLIDEERFETTTPEETIGRALDYFRKQQKKRHILSLGIGSFGPVDLHSCSPSYGYITSTPKAGWSNTEFAGIFEDELNIPVGFDTDVNAAGLGEHCWGTAAGLRNFIYLTVGTGIGGGGMINGKLLHGVMHPEMGHIRIPHDQTRDPYPGCCPFHRDCFEGLASGPAIAGRWRKNPVELNDDHPAWKLEAHYIALALVNFICTTAPEKIIIGGGVMKQQRLYDMIRKKVADNMNDYMKTPALTDNISDYIVEPALGDKAGILGALALAKNAMSGATFRQVLP